MDGWMDGCLYNQKEGQEEVGEHVDEQLGGEGDGEENFQPGEDNLGRARARTRA